VQIFIIQSTTHGAAHLDSAIEAFLQSFRARLMELPQAEFDEQVSCLTAPECSERQKLQVGTMLTTPH
jgi:secreted Zn-dependent insulinase-like peptidase